MIDAKEFMGTEIEAALGDFRYHYDVEAIFDDLYDKGFVVFDERDGFAWRDDYSKYEDGDVRDIVYKNHEVDFEGLRERMDPEILSELQAEETPLYVLLESGGDFVEEYAEMHEKKHGRAFEPFEDLGFI